MDPTCRSRRSHLWKRSRLVRRIFSAAALAGLLTAILLQIGGYLANDVFDFERGTDTAERAGPVRVTQAVLLSAALAGTGQVALLFSILFWLGLLLSEKLPAAPFSF